MRSAFILSLGLWLAIGAGCKPYYVTPAANMPLFGHGGELHAAAHVNSTVGQADVQVAMAPVDYFAIMAAASIAEWKDEWHRKTYGEVAAGTFVPFGIGRFEAFVGGGFGDSRGDGFVIEPGTGNLVDGRVEGPYSRVFVQADLGLSTKIVDFGLVSRWSWIRADLDYSTGQSGEADSSFLEEILVFRVGHDPVKAEFQGGWIWPTSGHLRIEYIPWHFSIGLHVKFDLWGSEVSENEEQSSDGGAGKT